MSDREDPGEKLSAAIVALEAQRAILGDAVVDPAIFGLRQQLQDLDRAASGDTRAPEERKLVTLLFADISGFTSLAEKLDPEEVRALISACFATLVPILQKYEGTIEKFIGDEIMAVFGAPVAQEDAAERALRTALEMMNAMAAFNAVHGTALNLHMGVNSGLVIAGEIGLHGRRDYSVMGDAVNLAARLEGASSEGEIFVGASTYRQTARLFQFEKLPPLDLQGKKGPVDAYRLLGLKQNPQPVRGIEGLRAALVGREKEQQAIALALNRLAEGTGGVIALMGEAGLGKSRLVAEARAVSPANLRWAEGRAFSYTGGMSYWLVRELLRDLLQLIPAALPGEVARALRESVEAEFGERVEAIYPYLARVFDQELLEGAMAERVQFLGAEALQTRMLDAFRDYIRACAARRPLLLVWEDLHWCDPSSLQFLEALVPLTREVPLLLVCALRPDETPARQMLDRACGKFPEVGRRLELRPLSRGQSTALIRELLQLEELPEKMRGTVLDRAEGNPFFVEELLRALIDAGVVVHAEGRARVTREITALDLPDTIQGVVAARIDRLATEQKQTLQKAAVLGRIFQERVLQQLYEPAARSRLEHSLFELQARGFVQSRQRPVAGTGAQEEGEYTFKHAITQDVAYRSMLFASRKTLHALAAKALERLFPTRLDELAGTVGYHFERAGAAPEAAHYLGRAGERAQATFANAEALAFYRAALAQIEKMAAAPQNASTLQSAARLNEGLGDVLTLTGEHAEAREAYERARVFLAHEDGVACSRLYRKTGFSHNLQRHYEETGRAFDLAEEKLAEITSARPAAWWEEKVQIQLERMHLYYWQGRAEEMGDLAGHFQSTVEQHGTALQRGKFFQMLALAQLTGSRYQPSEECQRLAERAVSESRGASNWSELSHVRFTLGLVHLWRGNFEEAIGHGGTALELAEKVGDEVIVARCVTYLAVAHRRAEQTESANACAKRALELARKLEMPEYVAMAHANLAWVAWRAGNGSATEQHATRALQLWHEMEDPYGVDWLALWPLCAAAFAQGRLADAVGYLRSLFGPNQHPLPLELAARARAAIAAWESDDAAAGAVLERALQEAREARHL